MGYHQAVFYPEEYPGDRIFSLDQIHIQLQGIDVFPGENPAHRIIKKVVENRDLYNPQKWESYQYNSYNKLVFSAFDDKGFLNSLPETLKTRQDSALYHFKKIIDRQDLFLVETASLKSFLKPEKEKETILASRASGIEDPSFFTLATQLQSLTFYNDYVTLLEKDFLSPVSPNSWNKYFFLLTDTLLTPENDTIFTIQFRPQKNKYFWGLKGVMNVHTNGYAIQSVRAEDANKPTDILRIKIEQRYEKMPEGHWFPKELNSEIVYNKFNITPVPGYSFLLKGSGKTYLFNQKVNPDLDKKDFRGANLEISEEAADRDAAYWEEYRNGLPDKRDSVTYHVIDSIGRAENLDQKTKMILGLFENKLDVGKLNLRLQHIIDYNHYEGMQLGLGLETNEKFSRLFQLGGYWRYGFEDRKQKFGADAAVRLNRKTESKVFFELKRDRQEIGEMFFLEQPRVFSSEEYRKLLYTDMFSIQSIRVAAEHRWSKFLKTRLFYDRTKYFDPMSLFPTMVPVGVFTLNKIGIKMRLSFGEQFFDNGHNIVSTGSRYPFVFINYENGFDHAGFNDYHSFELKVRDSFRMRNIGTSHLTLLGAVRNEIGFGNLFVSPPAAADHVISIYAENSFATMPMNEFFANRMAAVFWRHELGTLLYKTPKFKPRVSLAVNACWGDTKNEYPNFRTFEKGYYEGGLLIRRLLKQDIIALGFGIFYRFGPYHSNDFSDDTAIKFTMDIAL
ncbi:MAG: hypothetical protein A2W92_21620 [Bacteroidetes bacterium GWA2_42_15]|nr:MAG: hypothetical protein A2W92_21620 [Bacteroidetes bacterium GWA2_42_15]